MSVYPVILCGGPGERLWPASRPERPKPFLRLAGPRSGFQEAVLRAAPLADGGEVLVLGVAANADLIAEQLAEIGIHAAVLLEPVGRNTGPAVAAAAAWIAARSAAAIAVIVPADHHLPDAHAFQEAVRSTFPAAEAGAVVTLGMRPTAATTAYGYIRPGEGAGPVKPIAAFVEKPDAARAATLIAEGALWNSGTFVATAATLLEELGRHAPEGPALAFDRAVMEKTDRGAVLPVAFAWSDLGSWAAVWAAGDPAGAAAPMAPASIGPPPARFASLEAAASWLTAWLGRAALPLWGTAGVDAGNGGFREALTWLGAPHDPRRRARVQARQAFVFATAAAEGFEGPWLATARAGFDFLRRHGRAGGALFASVLDPEGRVTDPTPRLYEHAFVLLALAALRRAAPSDDLPSEAAVAVREGLAAFRHPAGGFREAGPEPFQANAHMHLLEAALAWMEVDGDAGWRSLADEVAGLALDRFIDPSTGALREFFDAQWRPLRGAAALIEPGHQFEWAWLLDRWGGPRALDAARALFGIGRRGVDPARGVVINALGDDLGVRDAAARLWPQTERLKAALLLGETEEALAAANALVPWLDTPAQGVWRERMRADGGFVEEPSPATSLYHLAGAIFELRRQVSRRGREPC